MRSSSTARFRKTLVCPTTEALLRHGQKAPREARDPVAAHLAACDFCGAEMQLLSRFPPAASARPFVACAMPTPLRRLAEDLLAGPPLERARFAETVQEAEPLTLTDA